jgi:predicted nucleic acid-binding protein
VTAGAGDAAARPAVLVSDTGPLIALGKLDLLGLLDALFGGAVIPPAVHRELLAKTGPEAARLTAALGGSVRLRPDEPGSTAGTGVGAAVRGQGPGEREARRIASRLGALLLIDERAGRAAARAAGVPVSGVVGLLIRAKAVGLVPAVGPLLEELRGRGYWLSDAVLAAARALAGESPGPPGAPPAAGGPE